jgi:lipid-A-disaccharide synthase
MAAPVLARLAVSAAGIGGPALRAAGLEISTDLRRLSVMGIGDVVWQAPVVVEAARQLLSLARARRPRAALLVGYSEFNAFIGPRLRRLGTRVLWYGLPQIWAWRPGRAPAIARACDRMAVLLPFESDLWKRHGQDAVYVGHPALEHRPRAKAVLASQLGLTSPSVALLPGSRFGELRRHLRPMLAAVEELRRQRAPLDARLILAPSLLETHKSWARQEAHRFGCAVSEDPAGPVLPAFDIAIASSGTVTLECAVAGVPPLIVYRLDWLSAALARRLVLIPSVGLPNIVLGEQVFPELLQEQVQPKTILRYAQILLDERTRLVNECERVKRALQPNDENLALPPSERVAALLTPWLS